MMKNSSKKQNYLDRKPLRRKDLNWTVKDGIVTLEIVNKGVMNRIFQKLLKKPKISYIHLDEMGSFIWPILDGEKTVFDLGISVKDNFGEKAEPLYDRLCQYIKILEGYNFIEFNN